MLTALVLGGAATVWDDAAAALDMFDPGMVLAVNDIAARWTGQVDYLVTLHPEKLPMWQAQRLRRGMNGPATVAHEPPADVVMDYRFPGMNASGSSGLFAVKVALEAGADRVVLAGVPMTPTPHFFDAGHWGERESFAGAWEIALPHIAGRVRSLSGWTRELLGAPTPDWLGG